MRFIRLLLANQIAYIFRSNDNIEYQKVLDGVLQIKEILQLLSSTTYHFIFFFLSVRAAVKSDSKCWWTQLCIISWQSVITDTTNRDGVNWRRISVTITIVVRQTTVACRPNKNVAFSITTLFKYRKKYHKWKHIFFTFKSYVRSDVAKGHVMLRYPWWLSRVSPSVIHT